MQYLFCDVDGCLSPGRGREFDLGAIRARLLELTDGRIAFEPCKDFSLSFRLTAGLADPDAGRECAWMAERYVPPDALTTTYSNSAVDIGPAGTGKGGAAARVARSKDAAASSTQA